jgi:acetate---CoA ligase (ADP-forming)
MDILPLIKPRSVAVIGASRDIKKIGAQIMHNLIKTGFEGTLYPINTKAETVQGIKAYASINDIHAEIDLVVIAIPKQFVKDIVKSCIEKKVKSICIISAGFKEVDEEGAHLEHEIAQLCKKASIPLLGPNCLGIINPTIKLNASFTAQMPLNGNITFISQSGAFGTAAIDWANAHTVGFNLFVSLGNKALLNENPFLQTVQAGTKVVAMYLESITNGEQFLDSAAAIGRTTPVILLKPGKSKDAQAAAKSHTGSLTGSDSVVTTACNQAGIIRANDSQELFDLMKAFSFLNELKGNNVAIITNAGGPSIMATDTLEECGLKLAPLSEKTQKTLSQYLPREANIHDPVDLIGDAKADRYDHALGAVLDETNVDACVVLLTPQSSTEVELTAQHIIKHAQASGKPVVASFIGGAHIEKAVHILNTHHIPCYEYPEQAVRTLGKIWQYYKNQEKLQLSLTHTTGTFIGQSSQNLLLSKIQSTNRNFLLQDEIEELLKEASVEFPKKKTVTSADDAWERAQEIGTPVVMKIASPNIIHKTDAHAVALNLRDEDEINDTFGRLQKINEKYGNQGYIYIQKQLPKSVELLIGVKRDQVFGPVIVFGTGGIYTEIYKDTSSRIAPLSRNTALEMINETKVAKILNGYRGEQTYDLTKIVQILVGLANLSRSYPQISEIDINPLIMINDIPTALDARIILEK